MSGALELATGAELRRRGAPGGRAVLLLNGGQRREVPGTWSASLEWLAARLAPRFPQLGFAELRYRVKSWRRLESCEADTRAAIETLRASRLLLVGFSMGGAVAISLADEPAVEAVLGLAPWITSRLDLSPLRGKRLDVLHGSLDRGLPGVPGVASSLSRAGFERARALGVEGSYTLIPGAVHGLALRAPGGRLVPLPRAGRWARLAAAHVERFAG